MATAPEPETGVWAMRAKYEKQLLKDEYDLFWWAKQQDTYFDWKVDVTDEFDTRSEKILCALHLQTMHVYKFYAGAPSTCEELLRDHVSAGMSWHALLCALASGTLCMMRGQ
jgi:hypothetical protein